MRPETILDMMTAGSRFVDYGQQTNGSLRNICGQWEQIKRRDEKGNMVNVLQKRYSVDGTGTRSRRIGESAVDVAGEIVGSMSQTHMHVLSLVVGNDVDRAQARKAITAKLILKVTNSQKHDRFWPKEVRRRACKCGRMPAVAYELDLIALAINEFVQPSEFTTHFLRSDWFGMSESHWRAIMVQPYGFVWNILVNKWFQGGAIEHIERGLAKRRRS